MKLTLRTFTTPDHTLGKLFDDQHNLICYTIEKPYLDNQKDISCVHAGTYDFLPRHSPTQGDTYYLSNPELDVTLDDPAGRTFIQWDVANWEHQLLGCIAGGLSMGILDGKTAVMNSSGAKRKLMKLLSGEKHQLEIFRY